MKRTAILALILTPFAVVGCSQNKSLREMTVTMVPAGGGSAISSDGRALLRFPPGALAEDTEITIEVKRDVQVSGLASMVYELGPDGLQFGQAVELEIEATGQTTQNLVLANLDEATPVAISNSVQTGNKVKGSLEHFSRYGAIFQYVPCLNKACGDTCTICAPNDPNCSETAVSKACNPQGDCVAETPNLCGGTPDAGIVMDSGVGCSSSQDCNRGERCVNAVCISVPDSGPNTPDTGVIPDSGLADGGNQACAADIDCNAGICQNGACRPIPFETEPNNTGQTANGLLAATGVIAPIGGAIDPANDQDYFSITVPPQAVGVVGARTHGVWGNAGACGGIDTVLTLFDSNGVVLAENDDRNSTCSDIGTITLSAGTYYFRVTGFAMNRAIARYYLDVSLTLGGPTPDAGIPMDAGNAPPQGIVVSTSQLNLAPNATGTFNVQLRNPPANPITVQITSSDVTAVAVSPAVLTFTPNNQPQAVTVTVLAMIPGGPTSVALALSSAGLPSVTVQVNIASTGSVINEVEPNDSFGSQTVTGTSLTILGAISTGNDRDCFRVAIPPAVPISTVTARTYTQLGNPAICSGVDTVVSIYANGAQVASNDDIGSGNFCSEATWTPALGVLSVFDVCVTGFGNTPGGAPYYLDIDAR